MDYKDLSEKYHELLAENKTLKKENEALKARLKLNQKSESDQDQGNSSNAAVEQFAQESAPYLDRIEQGVATPCSVFTNSVDKLILFTHSHIRQTPDGCGYSYG